MKKKTIRVNLGSGNDYLEGWINVDIHKGTKVDIQADLSKSFPFDTESVDEIKASDILEHFTKEDGVTFLRECHRVLKVNGTLFLRTHNIYQIYTQFRNDPEVLAHFLYGDTSETGIFGAHKYAYTEKTIRFLLKKLGFTLVSLDKESTNFEIIAKKNNNTRRKKLNIGIVMQTPDIGGAETYMYSLINEFQNNDNNVILATNLNKFISYLRPLSLPIYKIPLIIDIMGNLRGLIKTCILFPYALWYYSRLLSQFKEKNIDVILMSGFTEKLLVTFLAQFYSIPTVWIEYGRLETVFKRNFSFPKLVYRLLKDLPVSVIVPTKNTQQSLITQARVSYAKLRVIPCGIPVFVSKSKKGQIEDLKNKFIIGSVSRLTREKGQEFIIKAMPEILKHIPNAVLLLIGDGPDKEYYETLCKQLNIEKNVKITGFVASTHEYFSLMDVFIFPTIWELEGFGLVSIEASLHKLPVIASNIPPVPEIIDNEETGVLVPPGDAKSIATAVICLSRDANERKRLGENGYKKVLQEYNINHIAEEITEVLADATLISK